jgi:hypothetical protein
LWSLLQSCLWDGKRKRPVKLRYYPLPSFCMLWLSSRSPFMSNEGMNKESRERVLVSPAHHLQSGLSDQLEDYVPIRLSAWARISSYTYHALSLSSSHRSSSRRSSGSFSFHKFPLKVFASWPIVRQVPTPLTETEFEKVFVDDGGPGSSRPFILHPQCPAKRGNGS